MQPEKHLLELLDTHLKTGGTFVDIGAHAGYYSLYARDIVGEDGYIVMVEPNRVMHPIIESNFRQHDIDINADNDVLLYRAAASNDVTARTFRSDYYSEASRLLDADYVRGDSGHEYTILTSTVDGMVTDADFIKIDAEGEEYNILLGMDNLLTNSKPFLLIEIHHDQNVVLTDVVELLNQYNYTCFGRKLDGELVSSGNIYERTKHMIALHLKDGESCPY